MNEHDVLAERFEAHRARLQALAYHTLGSASEADDAVREAWLRLSRSDPGTIDNLGGWLTTAVGRVCLNMLASRREQPAGMNLAESVVSDADGADPETEAVLADSIGPALLVILHTLAPPSGSHSSCTTRSPSRSMTSRPSSGARPPRPANWPVAPAGGSRAWPRSPAPI